MATDANTFRTNMHGFRREIRAPLVPLPDRACDTHMHIVGPFDRYPLRETRSLTPPESTLDDYRAVLARTGLQRNVIVQPIFFAKDNACTLDACVALAGDARAVVVVDPDVDEATLMAMHRQGARGIRIQRVVAGGASIEDIETLAAKIAPLGWHIQLFVDASDLADLRPTLAALPVDLVFDHMAHVARDSRIDHPGFATLLDLLDSGKAWVKLSNARFQPDAERARRLIAANAERVLWGSDWPHVAYQEEVPDDGELLDRLAAWAPDDLTRRRILADNPDALYFRV